MRKSYHGTFLNNKQNELCGINLGANYDTEYEFTIDGIHQLFSIGTDIDAHGYKKQQVLDVPDDNFEGSEFKYRGEKYFFLYAVHHFWSFDELETLEDKVAYFGLLPHIHHHETSDFCAMWDDNGFAILFCEDVIDKGKEIYRAFLNKDLLIFIGDTKSPFDRGGLRFQILSKTDDDVLKKLDIDDTDYQNLLKTVDKTGIQKYLKSKKKNYYVLHPRWKDEDKTEVFFWLHPEEQEKYNDGWFTVDELKQWGKEKGPIIKQTEYLLPPA